MATGEVLERNLTGADYSMEFPIINGKYVGRRNEFAYTQVVDLESSSISGMPKYGGLAKLHLQDKEEEEEEDEESVRLEYHMFPKNSFCTGAAFVAKQGGREEDDGWIITYVHDEDSNTSHVYVVDVKNLSNDPIAKIDLPTRVPYGFHGSFLPLKQSNP